MSVFEFYHRTDVAGTEFSDRFAVFAVHYIHLADTFGDLAIAVIQFRTTLHRPRINAEERQFAEMRFAIVLNTNADVSGSVKRTSVGCPLASSAAYRFRSTGEEPYFAMKSMRRATPTFVSAEVQKQRNEVLLLHRFVYAGPKLLFAQAALVEKFRQQSVVRLGDVLDHLGVKLFDPRFPFAGRGNFLVFAAITCVGADLIAQNVEHLIEARARDSSGMFIGNTPAP